MTQFGVLLFWAVCCSATLTAGQVYGTLRDGGNGIPGARIEISCGPIRYPALATEQDGSYRTFIREPGRCTFQVTSGPRVASTEIFASNDPVRYDFDLVNDGKSFVLRRR